MKVLETYVVQSDGRENYFMAMEARALNRTILGTWDANQFQVGDKIAIAILDDEGDSE